LLDWSNQTKFPLTLILAGKGSFINPFHINLRDPLSKSLLFSFQEIDIMVEKYLNKKKKENQTGL
jgi:hypothetical protein